MLSVLKHFSNSKKCFTISETLWEVLYEHWNTLKSPLRTVKHSKKCFKISKTVEKMLSDQWNNLKSPLRTVKHSEKSVTKRETLNKVHYELRNSMKTSLRTPKQLETHSKTDLVSAFFRHKNSPKIVSSENKNHLNIEMAPAPVSLGHVTDFRCSGAGLAWVSLGTILAFTFF